MTDVEDKIRKLLALASHPNTPVDEARTAALQAARLMREHKVEVGAAPIFGPPNAPMPAWAAIGTLIHTMIDVMLRSQPAPPPQPPPPRTPFDELFWDRWARQNPAPVKKKRRPRKRKGSAHAPKERRRK